jgi:HAD superfamily hydrolase (TIGR01549 family)
MGGDQLVAALAGEEFDAEHGDAVRDAEKERYMALIEEVEPLAGARDLLVRLNQRGHAIVLASSAKQDEADHYLDLLDARDLAEGWTTSADVEKTKPEPDVVAAAIEKAGGGPAVMIGDSTWDAEAAKRLDVPTIGVLTGGFSELELREAGAACVYQNLHDLLEHLEDTPLR